MFASFWRRREAVRALSFGHSREIPKAFAEEWLAWRDSHKAERETFRNKKLFWTRWIGLAATVTGLSAAIGWILTIWLKS
jgi:hypothetical protein